MLSFVTTAFSFLSKYKSWIYVAIAAIIALVAGGGYFYIKYLQNERDALKTQLSTVVAVYQENVKQFDELKYTHEKSLALLAIQHKEELEKVQKLTTIKEEIKNVKESDDAPIANILRDTIIRLQ